MQNKYKEYIFIGALVIILLIAYFAVPYLTTNKLKEVQLVEVRYKDEEIMTFDIDIDKHYTIEVDNGLMHIEVKNSRYRVYDVDCPDKICEKVGWVEKNSSTLIVCLPNNIVLVQI